jgi:hypothetical protein
MYHLGEFLVNFSYGPFCKNMVFFNDYCVKIQNYTKTIVGDVI